MANWYSLKVDIWPFLRHLDTAALLTPSARYRLQRIALLRHCCIDPLRDQRLHICVGMYGPVNHRVIIKKYSEFVKSQN